MTMAKLIATTFLLLHEVSTHAALSGKKGVGLTRANGSDQLQALKVSWFYNWGSSSNVSVDGIPFVPMVFSKNSLPSLQGSHLGEIVLGFNEPDNVHQSNMEVQDALTHWPQVTALATNVGSPATAGNPTIKWLPDFMKEQPKVDFVTLHWYKGPNAARFKSDVQALISTYKLPVWVTEFAPQTVHEASAEPAKYNQETVAAFISEVVTWMEGEPMVQAYAWHDSKTGTSSLFYSDGSLTATGKAYASAGHAKLNITASEVTAGMTVIL